MLPSKKLVEAMLPISFREDLKMSSKVAEQNTKAIERMLKELQLMKKEFVRELANVKKEIKRL